jgi:hypothetical protein
MMKSKSLLILAVLICLTAACAGKKEAVLDGHWRAAWDSSGGEIPVDLYLRTNSAGGLEAEVRNDSEVVRFSRVVRSGNDINFYIDRYECVIKASLAEDGMSMSGHWSKQTGSPNKMSFSAVKADLERFPRETYPGLSDEAPVENISGTWKLRFEGDTYDSVALFRQDGERLTGTIRAIDGDFRYLEGVYRNGLLLLSSFNGTWVFLFKAEMDSQGILHGFWARGPREPAKWTAIREEPNYPDSFQITRLSNPEGRLRFRYPSVADPQRYISNEDPKFMGKPLLAAFLLTGCPNSHDSGALLSQLYREYHPQGLNMVLVFYELIQDVQLTRERIQRFMQEHELPCSASFSLAMSKKEIGAEIPDFETFYAWPTVVFYNSLGKVDCIQTGIDGPATGVHYDNLVREYRNRIEKLLSPQIE